MKFPTVAWACLAGLVFMPWARADAPQYNIIDLGIPSGSTGVAAKAVSPDGSVVAGFYAGVYPSTAFLWTASGGMQSLVNPAGFVNGTANAVNNSGVAAGTVSRAGGSDPMPAIWRDGAVSQLALPTGMTNGLVNAINSQGIAAGAVFSPNGVAHAALFDATGSSVVAAQSGGAVMTNATGINDAGLVVGYGSDPGNPAVNVAMLYDSKSGTMTNLGAVPGANGGLSHAVSNSGLVVGSSMLYQGFGQAFIWSAQSGMSAIPFPDYTFYSAAYGVNDKGWVVGVAGGQYAVPFLYENGKTYSLASLLPADTPWDLSTNTSASAQAISDNGIIVGRGMLDGQVHAFEMVPVPEPASWALMLAGLAIGIPGWRRKMAAAARRGD